MRVPTKRQLSVQEGVVPKARRPMALFTAAFMQQRGLVKGAGCGRAAYLQGFRDAATAWRDLPAAEKQTFQAQSKKEFAQQGEELVNKGVVGRKRVKKEEDPVATQGEAVISCTLAGYRWAQRSADLLGKGTYGCVFRGEAIQSRVPVAVKVYVYTDGLDFKQECAMYRRIQADTCRLPMPFLQMWAAATADSGVHAMVLDLVGGTLRNLLRDEACATVDLYPAVASQMTSALRFLHTLGIVHLDVKPPNILVRWGERRVFLADFGMSELAGETKPLYRSYGTCNYRAPELWEQAKTPPKCLQPSADLWSFGCVLWEVCTRRMLFSGAEERGVRNAVMDFVQSGSLREAAWRRSYWGRRLALAGPAIAEWGSTMFCGKQAQRAWPQGLGETS